MGESELYPENTDRPASSYLRGVREAELWFHDSPLRRSLDVFENSHGIIVYANREPVPVGLLSRRWVPSVRSITDLEAATMADAKRANQVLDALQLEVC